MGRFMALICGGDYMGVNFPNLINSHSVLYGDHTSIKQGFLKKELLGRLGTSDG